MGVKIVVRKRILPFFCALLLLPCAACAQPYDLCVQSAPLTDIAKYPPPVVPLCERVDDSYFNDAVLIGCSIMSGVELSGGVDQAAFVTRIGMSPRGAMHNKNFKVGNQYLTMAEYVVTLAPAKLYIMLGSNGVDIKRVPVVLLEMNELLNHLIGQLPDTLLYVISIPPVTPMVRERSPYLTDAKIAAYNEGLRELASLHNIYYLDIYAQLADENGRTDSRYAAGDGYHLQSVGYALVAEYLYTHAIPLGNGTKD